MRSGNAAHASHKKCRFAHRARADDHLIDTGVEVALDRRDFANTAADLHGYATRGRADRANDRGIARFARHGTVEIDEVQTSTAFREPLPRHRNRVVAEHGHVVHATLPKPDALAIFDVDRGDDEHRAPTACLSSTASLCRGAHRASPPSAARDRML